MLQSIQTFGVTSTMYRLKHIVMRVVKQHTLISAEGAAPQHVSMAKQITGAPRVEVGLLENKSPGVSPYVFHEIRQRETPFSGAAAL